MGKENFSIKYKIGKKEIDSIKKIKKYENDFHVNGYISIIIGNYEYGFLPGKISDEGFELLKLWFNSLKDVFQKLQCESTVVLNYWENPVDFFTFEKINGNIVIKYFKKTYPVINGRIETNFVYEIELISEAVMNQQSFFKIMKTAVNNFWDEVISYNPVLKDHAGCFKISV